MTSERIFGFDLIRSLATIVIVFHHSSFLFADYYTIPDTLKFPDPVDLFFVGSGFLVGRILITHFITRDDYSVQNALTFLRRRWFRTFPNYYLFLVINLVLVLLELSPGKLNSHSILYFGFLQNVHKPLDLFFWESWSLVVEEWFYLIFPLLLLCIYRLFKYKVFNGRKAFLGITLTLILFPTIYRLVVYDAALDWDIFFRKLTVTRMDTIGYGLLAAYLQVYHFSTFRKYHWLTFLLGLFLYFFPSLFFNSWDHDFQCTWFFSITAIGVTLLFPMLYRWKEEPIKNKPSRFVALISYSVYLCHLPIAYIMQPLFNEISLINTLLLYLVYWSIVLTVSNLIYKYFEHPITNLRDRFG